MLAENVIITQEVLNQRLLSKRALAAQGGKHQHISKAANV